MCHKIDISTPTANGPFCNAAIDGAESSVPGQSRHFGRASAISALAPKADIWLQRNTVILFQGRNWNSTN